MKSFTRYLLIYLFCFILAACSNRVYTPIPEDQSVILTINIKDMTVSFVDIDSQKMIAEWEMDKPYSGGVILPDHDTLLLYGKQVDTTDLYSLSTGEYIKSWNTGKGIVNGTLLKNQKEIVLVDQLLKKVRFFTIKGKEIAAISTEQNPFTILEGGDKVFVLNVNDEELTVIDPKNKVKLENFTIHPSAAGALFNEDEEELWIGGHGVGTDVESDIHVYNSKTGELLKTVHAPLMPINFVNWGKYIFVLSHGSNTLYQLTKDGEQLQSIQIGANPFELTIFHDELIIAGYDSNDIYFVDPKNLKIKQKVNVGRGPFQMILRESEQDVE